MDVFILIGTFTIVCLMGMPVAYALGIAAILAALWIDLPLEAVMLKVSGGMSGFSRQAQDRTETRCFGSCGATVAGYGLSRPDPALTLAAAPARDDGEPT